MFETYDNNFFASDFIINMFVDTFKEFGNYVGLTTDKTKVRRVGWSYGVFGRFNLAQHTKAWTKKISFYFHRIVPKSNPDIFYDLKDALPNMNLLKREKELSKNEYP